MQTNIKMAQSDRGEAVDICVGNAYSICIFDGLLRGYQNIVLYCWWKDTAWKDKTICIIEVASSVYCGVTKSFKFEIGYTCMSEYIRPLFTFLIN